MKKKIKPVIFIIALIIIIGLIYGGQILYEHFSYSREKADLNDYYNLTDPTQAVLFVDDELKEEKASCFNGAFYLDFDLVKEYVSNRFYFGKADGILVYTGPNEIYTSGIGTTTVTTSDGTAEDLGYTVSMLDGDKLYVAVQYLRRYTDMSFESYMDEGPARIRIFTGKGTEVQTGTLKKSIAIRKLGGRKSEIVATVPAEQVTVVEQMEEWSRVVSSTGHIGYVENKNLKDIGPTILSGSPAEIDLGEYTSIKTDGKINLGFHPIGGIAGNETVSGVIGQAKSLNIIAPTWFSLSDTEGNISSYATNDYITTAHANGLQVWAVVDNFNNENRPETEAVLSRASSRANLIANLLQKQAEYGFEGINVDFELISESYADSYLEFLRELSVACRRNQIILSIDNYVPMNFNDYYDLTEQGIISDYVIIMGYDEHYAGSEEAGSVASIGYVQNGINKALEEVPADKLVNAIPFYARLWITSGGELSSKAIHMSALANIISEYGMEMKWDEETCQNYGEVTASNGDFYQLWSEDASSIETKLNVMKSANIAGVAEWALGFESADIWDVITNYLNS
ncbi:glycosyl hydrolase family 18 protein [Butyrivibrio sp. LC3010]|uniref:glycosyl hydrolase family 18 protein n=1 Tax=Butyrivibrio sp. LC3010 TaxID=1280680 RepID=UPI000410DEFE|nr:glycosyl hydrolase family 18 protein [Butyrivibrio sp. LC3010]